MREKVLVSNVWFRLYDPDDTRDVWFHLSGTGTVRVASSAAEPSASSAGWSVSEGPHTMPTVIDKDVWVKLTSGASTVVWSQAEAEQGTCAFVWNAGTASWSLTSGGNQCSQGHTATQPGSAGTANGEVRLGTCTVDPNGYSVWEWNGSAWVIFENAADSGYAPVAPTGNGTYVSELRYGTVVINEADWEWNTPPGEWLLITNRCAVGYSPAEPLTTGTVDGEQRTTPCT